MLEQNAAPVPDQPSLEAIGKTRDMLAVWIASLPKDGDSLSVENAGPYQVSMRRLSEGLVGADEAAGLDGDVAMSIMFARSLLEITESALWNVCALDVELLPVSGVEATAREAFDLMSGAVEQMQNVVARCEEVVHG